MTDASARPDKMLPDTTRRVPAHTALPVNERIEAAMAESVRRCAANPGLIGRRLRELDEEWDIERALEANAAAIGFAGVALAGTVDRRLLWLPALVTGFLLQHALQGWCPPVPVLRRLGFRTAAEIGRERMALKALRGDFADVPQAGNPMMRAEAALAAARGDGADAAADQPPWHATSAAAPPSTREAARVH